MCVASGCSFKDTYTMFYQLKGVVSKFAVTL